MNLNDRIVGMHPELTRIRRDIHAHPELGFEEQRTAELVATELAACGCDVQRKVGKTGVVGTLKAGAGSRAIGLRADMDALPIAEANTFAHRSQNQGRMHACGHDGHTTMLLGAARYLAATKNFDGAVHFIFQPAEEGMGGAQAMIDDGLFERFPCEAVFGMHNRPSLKVGKFAVHPGPMMAGGAFFDISVTGKGAHGARPESGIDSVLVASHIVAALQAIVSRNTAPTETAVLSVTKIHGGDAYNVIPQNVQLAGTVRAFSRQVMALVETNIKRTATQIAQAFGATAEVDFRFIYAPTVNNVAEATFVAGVCTELVGADNVVRNPPLIMASEDFSFMLEKVPGCYFNIGNGSVEGDCEVHNPGYDFNDEALPLGVGILARIVETRLAKQ